ncbi:hypothetical protein LB505_003053 [Fusarium chuoi]|nr:hypothetical protein LB505_003053 [Fusarium chuoi]
MDDVGGATASQWSYDAASTDKQPVVKPAERVAIRDPKYKEKAYTKDPDQSTTSEQFTSPLLLGTSSLRSRPNTGRSSKTFGTRLSSSRRASFMNYTRTMPLWDIRSSTSR